MMMLLIRNKTVVICSGILLFILLCVLIGPFVSPYLPDQISDSQFHAPSPEHWFGTDVHGRDLLTRVLAGARISLLVGIVGALVSLIIGVSWGMLAGYLGGKMDHAMMRVVDILYSLPSILFVIVLVTSLEAILQSKFPAFFQGAWGGISRVVFLFVGLGAVSWLTMARIIRGQVLSLRRSAFVEAASALGVTHPRIILRHILPNLAGIITVYVMLTIPSIILYESFLSYLGLGIQPPMASWGSLIAEGAAHLNPVRVYWWLLVFPAGTLALTLLTLNFLGDALRKAVE